MKMFFTNVVFLFSARNDAKTKRFFVELSVAKYTKFAKKNMRTDSNEFIYAVATIVIAHFVIGFIWLWRKMNKKK
jgi:hypothetical protein